MGYVAAGYIAVFGTLGVYTSWALIKSRRAAAQVLAAQRARGDER